MLKPISFTLFWVAAALATVIPAAPFAPARNLDREADTKPVTVTISEVQAFCDPEDSGQDFYASVEIDGISHRFADDAGDDDNHIFPGWTFTVDVDSTDATVPVEIEMREQDGGWPFGIDLNDPVDIHPDADQEQLVISFDAATGEWTVDGDTPPDGPRDGVWRGSNGVDCAEVHFDIATTDIDGDTDGDGLLDSWEQFGLDADGDGAVDVDLPAMGARLDHKDLFVELDWMQAAGHSHEPWQAAWIPVWHAFDNAPVLNPDGTTGIKLHVDTGTLYTLLGSADCDGDGTATPGDMDCDGDGIIDIGNLGALGAGTPGGGNLLAEQQFLDFLGDGSPNDFYTVKGANFNPLRAQVFHYAAFVHSMNAANSTTSGRAEIFGNDVIVSLGGWANGGVSPITGLNVRGTIAQHGGTFMHELGHNLNLRHGGGDDGLYKPNYLSVMNYDHQMGILGLTGNGGLDYSPRALPPLLGGGLDENNLDECVPLNDPRPGVVAQWTMGNDAATVFNAAAFGLNSGVDWNQDALGTADDGASCGNANYVLDLNFRDTVVLQQDVLEGHDDWNGGDLRLDFRHSEDFVDGLPAELVEEITAEQNDTIQANRPAVVRLTAPDQFCPDATMIAFDDLPVGTLVADQYAALGVHVVDNDLIDPKIRDAVERGTGTSSPPNSLYASLQSGGSSFGIPLTITFDVPMFRVGMYVGNGGTLPPPAGLRAYLADGTLIGEVSDRVSDPVTKFLGIYALAGGIRRIELNTLSVDAEEIDDLIFDACEHVPGGPITATDPFAYTVRAETGDLVPMGDESKWVVSELDGVPVQVNGIVQHTTHTGETERGEPFILVAPRWTVAPDGRMLTFRYWRQDEFLAFRDGQTRLEEIPERNTTYTAVYFPAYQLYLPLVPRGGYQGTMP